MTKLTAQGYEVLDPGRCVLEVLEAESVDEFGPQLKLKLRVAQGERAAQNRTNPVGAPSLRSDGRFPRERRWTLKVRGAHRAPNGGVQAARFRPTGRGPGGG
jgi:hypothetical protein